MNDKPGNDGRRSGLAGGRRRAVVVVAATIAAVLLAVAGTVTLVQGLGDGEPGAAASPDVSQEPDGAPPAVELPQSVEPSEEAQQLPADGAVGPGALVVTCRACDTTLVLADGTQYVLAAGIDASSLHYGLSPDGRWLTVPDSGGMAVRDLTGDQLHRVEAAAGQVLVPWVWSPDSQWLLLAELEADATGPPAEYRLLDLADGADVPVTAPAGREFVAVLPSGQLWAADVARGGSDAPVRTVEVEVVDAASGPVGSFTVDAGEWLEAGESLARGAGEIAGGMVFQGGVQPMLAADGDGLYLPVFGDAFPPAALLRADRDGNVQQRLEVSVDDPRGIWLIAGQLGGEVVLAQSRAVSGSVTLYAVSEAGLRELTTVAPAVSVRIPGAAVHGGSPL